MKEDLINDDQCPFCRELLNVCTCSKCLKMVDYMIHHLDDTKRAEYVYALRVNRSAA
jgi:hypothetical protein